MIGVYGNSWIRTPHFDQLACESFLFDQAVNDCPQLDRVYRAYWFGVHAVQQQLPADAASFPRLVRAAGLHTALLTDEPTILGFRGAEDFSEQLHVESVAEGRAADDAGETQIAQVCGRSHGVAANSAATILPVDSCPSNGRAVGCTVGTTRSVC